MSTNAKLSTTSEWLQASTRLLTKNNVATARLDSLVLLEDALGKDKSYILAHSETSLTTTQLDKLNSQIERRKKHEPLAYIRGKSEFYGREFIVNKHTLEPRPETETMIELLLNQVKSEKLKVKSIVDVGTGSGTIAISIKLERPELTVLATDISSECIKIATANAQKLGSNIRLLQGNLLEPLSTFDFSLSALLCNLPYVPDSHTINKAAMQEPKLAIFGGEDGLDVYRQLFEQICTQQMNAQFIFTESLPFQHNELIQIAKKHGYKLLKTEDFIQVFSR